MKNNVKNNVVIITFIAELILADQITKFCVRKYMEIGETISVMTSFAIHYTQNTGIAFSMLRNVGNNILIIISAVILVFVIVIWKQSKRNRKMINIGFSLIVAGAIGNIIDRAMFGYVTDFILIYISNWHFAVFNMADAYITLGVIVLVVDELKPKRLMSK